MPHDSSSRLCFPIEACSKLRANTLKLLQGLITNDAVGLGRGAARFAGLLSPQGKILFDFFLIDAGESLLLDCPSASGSDLLKRLTFYKLRAKITLSDVSERWRVASAWGEGAADFCAANASIAFPDPRLPDLGFRALVEADRASHFPAGESDYEAMRIPLAVPEGGKDYAYGDAFPHEACFDLLNGVNFKKGCYVGRGSWCSGCSTGARHARACSQFQRPARCPLAVRTFSWMASRWARLGSVSENRGIALARLDKVAEAMAKGQSLEAGGIPVSLTVPSWATYKLDSGTAGATP